MKILQISPTYLPANEYGGAAYIMYEIAERLSKMGHIVWVYTTDAKNKRERISKYNRTNSNVNIIYFRNLSNKFAYLSKIFISPGMFFKLKKEIDYFDIIHLHDFRTIQNIFVYFLTRKKNKKIVLQAHGSVNPGYFSKSKLKALFDFLFGRRIIENTTSFVALSPIEKQHYKKFNVEKKKIKRINNGIKFDQNLEQISLGIFRKKFDISSSTKIIVFIGRIHPIKGLSLLINSFFLMKKKIPDIKLFIIGSDDGDLDRIVGLSKSLGIQKDLIFTGPLYGIEKTQALLDSDLLVLSSKYETFPVVVLEAWIHQTPIVITKNCGISDIVLNEKAGLVAEYEIQDFTEKMITLLTNNDLRKKVIINGLELVKREFDWDTIIEEYIRIYKEDQ